MINIFHLKPVNKTASIITSQKNTTDDFLLADKEILKVLGERKRHLADAMVALKKEIGIDGRENNGTRTKYPRCVLNHPKFKKFQKLRQSLTELDQEIYKVRQRIKKIEPIISLGDFFMDECKKINPSLYDEIKEKYYELKRTK